MTNIFHVVHYEYIAYERNSLNVLLSALTIEEAKKSLNEIIEYVFFRHYKKDEHTCLRRNRFDSIKGISANLSENERSDYINDVYIVEVKLGEIVNKKSLRKENAVWHIDNDYIFKLFSDELDFVMKKDYFPVLPLEEKSILWKSFLKNKNTFKRNKKFQMFGTKRQITDFLELEKDGADIWAMTTIEKNESFLYQQFEHNRIY